MGVRNNPGAIVHTRIPSVERSRAIGSVIDTIAPVEGMVVVDNLIG